MYNSRTKEVYNEMSTRKAAAAAAEEAAASSDSAG